MSGFVATLYERIKRRNVNTFTVINLIKINKEWWTIKCQTTSSNDRMGVNSIRQFHHGTGLEDPQLECSYSSTIASTSALDGGGCSTAQTGRFTFGNGTQYPFTEGWLGSSFGVDGYGKSRPNRDSIPDHPIRSTGWAYPSFYGSCR